MENKNKNIRVFFVVSVLLIILDQITKLLIKNYFGVSHTGTSFSIENWQNIRIIGDFLQFTYVENEGMAFGISFGAGKILLSLFSIVASIALAWYLYKLKDYSNWVKFGIAFILAGAVGNLIDRVFYGIFFDYAPIFYGRVIDFIQVDIPDIHWGFIDYTYFPIFNIADSCVTVGVVILLIVHKQIPSLAMLKNNIDNVPEIAETNGINPITEINNMENKNGIE